MTVFLVPQGMALAWSAVWDLHARGDLPIDNERGATLSTYDRESVVGRREAASADLRQPQLTRGTDHSLQATDLAMCLPNTAYERFEAFAARRTVRNASLTAVAVGNAFATSGSRSTRFTPFRYRR